MRASSRDHKGDRVRGEVSPSHLSQVSESFLCSWQFLHWEFGAVCSGCVVLSGTLPASNLSLAKGVPLSIASPGPLSGAL